MAKTVVCYVIMGLIVSIKADITHSDISQLERDIASNICADVFLINNTPHTICEVELEASGLLFPQVPIRCSTRIGSNDVKRLNANVMAHLNYDIRIKTSDGSLINFYNVHINAGKSCLIVRKEGRCYTYSIGKSGENGGYTEGDSPKSCSEFEDLDEEHSPVQTGNSLLFLNFPVWLRIMVLGVVVAVLAKMRK